MWLLMNDEDPTTPTIRILGHHDPVFSTVQRAFFYGTFCQPPLVAAEVLLAAQACWVYHPPVRGDGVPEKPRIRTLLERVREGPLPLPFHSYIDGKE